MRDMRTMTLNAMLIFVYIMLGMLINATFVLTYTNDYAHWRLVIGLTAAACLSIIYTYYFQTISSRHPS